MLVESTKPTEPDLVRLINRKLAIVYPRRSELLFDTTNDVDNTVVFLEALFPDLITYLKETMDPLHYATESEDGDEMHGSQTDEDDNGPSDIVIRHSLPWVLVGREKRRLVVVGSAPDGQTVSLLCGRPQAATVERILYLGES